MHGAPVKLSPGQERKALKRLGVIVLGAAVLAIAGFANMTPRQQPAQSGGAIGAEAVAARGTVVNHSPAVGAAR